MKKKTYIALAYSLLIFIYFRLASNNSIVAYFMPLIMVTVGEVSSKDELRLKKYGFFNSLLLILILAGGYFYKSKNALAYLTINELSDQILASVLVFIFFNYLVYE